MKQEATEVQREGHAAQAESPAFTPGSASTEGLLAAELPGRLGAVVAMSVIGHFDPAGRQRIWGCSPSGSSPAAGRC
jgi:hypothetical protein